MVIKESERNFGNSRIISDIIQNQRCNPPTPTPPQWKILDTSEEGLGNKISTKGVRTRGVETRQQVSFDPSLVGSSSDRAMFQLTNSKKESDSVPSSSIFSVSVSRVKDYQISETKTHVFPVKSLIKSRHSEQN